LPFTLAHTVAILPLRRPLGRHAVLSALVIGSIVPDFHYFFPYGPSRFSSHSLMGFFTFCLPVGALTYVLHHLLVAPLAWALAPTGVRAKLDPAGWSGRLPAHGPFAVAVSLAAGTLTHLAWDSFTHPGWATTAWPLLREPVFAGGGYHAYAYSVLQHGSTAFGLGVLAWKWSRRIPDPARAGRPALSRAARAALLGLIVLPAAIAALHTGFVYAEHAPGPLEALRRFIWHGLGGAVRVGALAVLGLGLAWRGWSASRVAEPPTTV
jgi:hypothetical protein